MNPTDYKPPLQAVRWLGYFDFLGTSALIKSGKSTEVFTAYQDALEQLNRWGERHANIYHAWFSDTFIMYSEDDSAGSFSAIEMVCRWFAFSLLRLKVPLRGALSCGEFYADRINSLYVGPALLDAYEWGENQDWIGFILCPSSVKRLDELALPLEERLNYVKYAVPFKNPPPLDSEMVGVCILGSGIRWGKESSVLLLKLKEMAKTQTDPRIRLKYERTMAFLLEHERRFAEIDR